MEEKHIKNRERQKERKNEREKLGEESNRKKVKKEDKEKEIKRERQRVKEIMFYLQNRFSKLNWFRIDLNVNFLFISKSFSWF